MCTIVTNDRLILIVTRTPNKCVRTCFCRDLQERCCQAECIDPKDFLGFRSTYFGVLIDCVDPDNLPEASELLFILRSVRPRPYRAVVLLPDKDYLGLTNIEFPFPVMFHFHKTGDPLDRVYDFLAMRDQGGPTPRAII